MKINKAHLIFFGFTALIISGTILYFIQSNIRGTAAAGEKVNVSFGLKTGNFQVGKTHSTTITINTGSSINKISGIDVTFKTTGKTFITDITQPYAAGGAPLNVNRILYNITGSEARVSYVFLNPNVELPQSVKFAVKFKGTAPGSGTIKLDTGLSKVVGTISSNVYGWGSIQSGYYTFTK